MLDEVKKIYDSLTTDKTALVKRINEAIALDEKNYDKESFAKLSEVLDRAKTVNLDTNAIQRDIDAIEAELQKAIANLGTNKDELNKTVDEALTKKAEDYSKESFENFAKVLEQAKAVKENPNATQKEIDEATENLKNALGALTTDKTKLEARIIEADGLKSSDYDKNSFENFAKVLEQAKAVKENPNATQKEIDTIEVELQKAIAQLGTDKSKLVEQINIAKSKVKEDYSTSSFDKLQEVFKLANDVNLNSNATQTEIDNATDALKKAIEALTTDKTILNRRIEIAESKKEEDFAKESYDKLKEVLLEAKRVSEDENATQSEINRIDNNLKEAIDNLFVNKIDLETTIKESESKKKENYSKESYASLETIKAEAKKVFEDENATQKQVDDITAKLKYAIAKLTVDKNLLSEEIEKGEKLVPNREAYTPDTYSVFETALNNAKLIFENPNATQKEVDDATKLLSDAISQLVQKDKLKPVVVVTEFKKDNKVKTATVKYDITDTENTLTGLKAKIYKGTELIAEKDVVNGEVVFDNLEYDVDYRIETEVTYDLGKGQKTDVLDDKREFRLEDEIKKVELKNITDFTIFRKVGDNFEAVSNFKTAPTDLGNYFVKVKSSTMSDSLLNVDSIVDNGDTFKVIAKAPELVQYKSADNDYTDNHEFLVSKASTKPGVITTFKELVSAIKENPSGDFVLGANISADEVALNSSALSYIDVPFTGTLKGEFEGKVYSISNLKAPLFSELNGAKVEKINLVNVTINSNKNMVGALSKTSVNGNGKNTVVDNVNVIGNIVASYDIGGLIGSAIRTDISNSTFTGSIAMTQSPETTRTGGIVGFAQHSTLRNLAVDATINTISYNNNNRASAIAGYAPNSRITDVYAKGSLINDRDAGQVAGLVGSLWDAGAISNALSEVNVTNGRLVQGDGGYGVSIKENVKAVTGTKGNTNGNETVVFVPSLDVETFKTERNIPTYKSESNTKNDSLVNYLSLTDAQPTKKQLYENIEKLMPLYNRDYIVKIGNKVNDTNLSTKKLLAVVPMVGDKVVTDTVKEKSNINKIMLHYDDNTVEYKNVNYTEDYKGAVSEYSVTGIDNLIYTPQHYVSDYSQLFNSVASDFNSVEFLSDEMFSILGLPQDQGDTAEERNDRLENLYLKESFAKVKENLESNLKSVLSNSNILGSTTGANNDYLMKYLKENKKELLLGMAYVQRWYNIDFDKVNIRDLTAFRQDFFGKNVNELEWLVNVGKSGFNTLNSVNNYSAYSPIMSGNNGLNNVFTFLENYKDKFVGVDKPMNTWFKESTKAYIVERPTLEAGDLNTTFYDTLKKEIRDYYGNLVVDYKRMPLPLLTMSEEGLYVIRSLSTVSFGSMERYVEGFDGLSPEAKKEKLNTIMKPKVDKHGELHGGHYDFWYRLTPQNTKAKLSRSVPNWDTLYNYNFSQWYPKYGNTPVSIKEFFGPTGTYGNYSEQKFQWWEAFAGGDSSTFIKVGILDDVNGPAVFAHEMTHNSDGGIYFGGYGRRDEMYMESYARGMFEPPRKPGVGLNPADIGINWIYDFSDVGDRLYNGKPDRFKSDRELQEYAAGFFSIMDSMDYAEAMALAGKPGEDLKFIIRQFRFDGSGQDSIAAPSAEEINSMNLNSIEAFVNNNITIFREPFPGGEDSSSNRNNYYKMPFFTPYFGAKTNVNGAPGGRVFRKLAFELLGAKGYEEGMLGYISNKHKAAAEAEGQPFTDAYVVKKIFNNEFKSFEEFKIDKFKKVVEKGGTLRPINIWYAGQSHTIDSLDKLKELFKRAVETDLNNLKAGGSRWQPEVFRLRGEVYRAYFKLTNEFRESIYK